MRLPTLAVLLIVLAGCVSGNAGGGKSAQHPAQFSPVSDQASCLRAQVSDEELAPVGNATLKIAELNVESHSDDNGTAHMCGVPAGTYDVKAVAAGFLSDLKRITFPAPDVVHFTLERLPADTSYHEILQKRIFYNVGMATLDTVSTRYLPLNNTVCSPCDFQFQTQKLPDVVFWETRWQRTLNTLPSDDWMHHIFRGGAPFENAPGDTTDRDIGSGSMQQPFRFQYPWNDLVESPPIKKAQESGGPYDFSGAMYCWGSPPTPCVNQRMDVYITLFYNVFLAPSDWTALPPK